MITAVCLLWLATGTMAGEAPKGAPPIAEPATYTIDEDTALRETLHAADSDGDPIVFVVAAPPKRGSVKIERKTGAFVYTPWKNAHGEDSFKFWASDGKLIGSAVITLHVTPVDDPPLLIGPPLVLTTAEDARSSARASAKDVDGDALSYRISKDPEHGEASVDAKGTVSYAPTQDYAGDDVFTLEVEAGGATVASEVKVAVVAVNDAPVASAGVGSGAEDEAITGTVSGNDVDGDVLSYRVTAQPTRGTLALDEKTGSYRYTPWKDAHGDDSFQFAASDGKLLGSGTVSLKVSPVDDPPVLLGPPLAIKTAEDTKAGGRINARDVDGDALNYRIAQPAEHGEASIDGNGALGYVPAHDFAGEDRFTVEVEAGGASATAEVRVTVLAMNDAPVATAAEASGAEDEVITGTVGGSDVDGDVLSYRATAPPKRGTLALDEKTGSYRYTPWKDAHGDDSFQFAASDGKLLGSATVSLKVSPVDDPPVLLGAPRIISISEDSKGSTRVSASDVDGDALSFRIVKDPEHGEASVDEKGVVSYAPARDYAGEDGLSVEVAAGGASVTGEVRVTVLPVNDAPVANAAEAAGAEDEVITGTVGGSDVDGDALRFRVIAQPKRGAITIDEASGAFRYTPWKDAHGDDSFQFAASDGKLLGSGTVTLKVAPVDDAPVLLGPPLALMAAEDGRGSLQLNARDVDGDVLGYRIAQPAEHGEASVDAKGGVSYVPAHDYHGEDHFIVEAEAGGASARGAVHVTVVAVNDAPVAIAAEASGVEDEAITGTVGGSDVDGDTLTFRVTGQPKRGTLTLDDTSGSYRYTPWRDAHGDDAFLFAVSDGKLLGSGTVALKVAAVDDPPVLFGPPLAMAITEDAKGSVQVNGRDADGDALSYRIAQPAEHGEASVDAKGRVSYAPARDYAGGDHFTVEVAAGGATTVGEVHVTVAPANDPPVIDTAALAETAEDTVYRGRLPAADPDGDPLAFKIVGKARLGVAALDDAASGAWHYLPNANVHGDDEVKFEAQARGQRVEGVARVRVLPENDVPTLTGLEATTSEEQAVEVKLVGSDIDGDRLTYQLVAPPTHGTAQLVDAATGVVRITPAADFTGELAFDVVARDGVSASAPARVRVQVQPVNDAPVLERLALKTSEDTSVKGKVRALDVDGDPLVFRVGEPSSLGEVVLGATHDGSFTFNPRKNASGATVFTIVAVDPAGATGSATVTITVTAVDDPPVAVGARELASRVGRMTGRLSGYDPEGARVRFRLLSQPSIGEVELLDATTGDYSYSTSGRGAGETSFLFVVEDGQLTSAPGRVDILVR